MKRITNFNFPLNFVTNFKFSYYNRNSRISSQYPNYGGFNKAFKLSEANLTLR